MRELKLDGECFLLAEQHLILESHSKYFDKSSEYYEANLTDTERRIAYNYEMQNALNVGNNGKNLYKHIYYCSTQDGCESSQVTEESKMKYEAYHQVYSYTGYKLDKLEEKNGTYYTESGENILDLVDSAVESSGKVPKEFNQQMKNWIHDLVSTISTRGWNNVPDMTLSILYGKSGLKDMNQLITYQYEADRMNRQWYSVL